MCYNSVQQGNSRQAKEGEILFLSELRHCNGFVSQEDRSKEPGAKIAVCLLHQTKFEFLDIPEATLPNGLPTSELVGLVGTFHDTTAVSPSMTRMMTPIGDTQHDHDYFEFKNGRKVLLQDLPIGTATTLIAVDPNEADCDVLIKPEQSPQSEGAMVGYAESDQQEEELITVGVG